MISTWSRIPFSRKNESARKVNSKRRDRALDGHVHDVHDQASAFPGLELLAKRCRAFVGVELVDALAPLALIHAGGLGWSRRRAGGDDQLVVLEHRAVQQQYRVGLGVDAVDLAVNEVDALGDEPLGGLDDLVGAVGAERDEEVAGLVVVDVALVDNGDLPLVAGKSGPELVDDHRSGGSATEYEQALHRALPSLRGFSTRT